MALNNFLSHQVDLCAAFKLRVHKLTEADSDVNFWLALNAGSIYGYIICS